LSVDGILNIIKPRGKSSFSMISLIRRLSGERRVGHTGTLDKGAEGVLPVCLGKATRVVEFLSDSRKIYRAKIKLGVVTDTYDADGSIIEEKDYSYVKQEQLERLLLSFIGKIAQVPPMYSAIKRDGTPLHRTALSSAMEHRCTGWRAPESKLNAGQGKSTFTVSTCWIGSRPSSPSKLNVARGLTFVVWPMISVVRSAAGHIWQVWFD